MKKQISIVIILSIILLLPIIFYIHQFNFNLKEATYQFNLSDQTSEWANLGSYIGGIYTPILSIITLALISAQIFIQNQQHTQSLIIHQEEQLKEYIFSLENELNQYIAESGTVRDFLVGLLRDIKSDEINELPSDLIMAFNEDHHRIFSMWCEVIKCLYILESLAEKRPSKNIYNKVVFESNRNKIVAYLNPQSCRMLDRFHYVFCVKCSEEGITTPTDSIKYYYSDLRVEK